MERNPNPNLRWLPYFILLIELLIFYWPVLSSSKHGIPFDLPGYHQPLAGFVSASVRSGRLPLWDPYTYCGVPLYANLQAQVFYPLAWPVFLLGALLKNHLFLLLEYEVVFHVFLAGVFTYWLLRRLNIGPWSALLGATIFQLGGFFASQIQHLGAVCGSAWLPLAWGAVLLLRQRFTWKSLGVLATAVSMSILAGFPPTIAAVTGSTLFLAIILVLLRRARPQLLASAGAGLVLGALVSAVGLLPAYELAKLSQASMRGEWTVAGGGLPLRALVSMAVPNYYQIFDLNRYAAHGFPWNPTFMYLYCGVAGLILGLVAIVWAQHQDRLVFVMLTAVSALWMLCDSTPVGKNLFPLLPKVLKGGFYAEFAMAAFLLGFAVLAAFGAEQLLAAISKLRHSVSRPTGSRPGPRGAAILVAVVALTAFDLTWVGSRTWMNTTDAPGTSYAEVDNSRTAPENMRALTTESFPPARIDVAGASHSWSSAAPLIEIPTANGDDPLALLCLLKVRLCFAQGKYWERYYQVSSPESPVLDLLNIRFVLTGADQILAGPKFFHRQDLPDGSRVYENRNVLPRFFLVNQVHRANGIEEAISLLRSPAFDPARMAIVEDSTEIVAQRPEAGARTVRTIGYAEQEVDLETDAPGSSFLVTSEVNYPGWHAWIDGRERPVVLTNGAFRGLPVPPGRHYIKMQFAPRILGLGAWISFLSVLLICEGIRRQGTRRVWTWRSQTRHP